MCKPDTMSTNVIGGCYNKPIFKPENWLPPLPFFPTKKEEPVTAIPDSLAEGDILDPLNVMREARHAAIRKMQALNDRAVLHDIEAARLRAQAVLIHKEINEDVPIPTDS